MQIWGWPPIPDVWVLGLVIRQWSGCIGCQCDSNNFLLSLKRCHLMQLWPSEEPGVGWCYRYQLHQAHHLQGHSCKNIGDSEPWNNKWFPHPVAGPMRWGLHQSRQLLYLLVHSWCSGQRSCQGGGVMAWLFRTFISLDLPVIFIILEIIPLLFAYFPHFGHKESKAQRHSLEADN